MAIDLSLWRILVVLCLLYRYHYALEVPQDLTLDDDTRFSIPGAAAWQVKTGFTRDEIPTQMNRAASLELRMKLISRSREEKTLSLGGLVQTPTSFECPYGCSKAVLSLV